MGVPYPVITDPIFQPAARVMEAITNASPAAITTTVPHLYLTGTVVRIDMPTGFGMPQVNQLVGAISVTGATTFTIDIDTSLMDPMLLFASWPTRAYSYPSVINVGEINSILTAATQNTL